MENDIEFWRQKCQSHEEIIKTLSSKCLKVILKHEELLGNYQRTQDQYEVMMQKMKEQKQQVKKAREVLGPVTREYQELKEKYDIAIRCQQEAEKFATKMNTTNKNLKRQSNMIMSKITAGQNIVAIDFDDVEVEDKVDEEQKKYLESLEVQIQDLIAEKASLNSSVKTLTEDLEIEKEKNDGLKKRLDEYKLELNRSNFRVTKQSKELLLLAKTSEVAVHEYKSLQDQYHIEIMNNKLMSNETRKLKAESMAAKHQSAALMSNISGDQKLMKAMIEVEELKIQLEKVKMDSQSQLKVLEEELEEEKNRSGMQAMEEENESLTSERDDLLQKLAEAEKAAYEAQAQQAELQGKCAELEEKYQKALNEPRIPPPPPPPPPPPTPPARTGIMALIAGSKKKKKELKNKRLEKGGAEVNQDFNKVLESMMARIQSGQALRPTLKNRSQSLPEENTAVSELEGLLKKMKKAKSEEDLTAADDAFADKDTELGLAFQKILNKKQDSGATADQATFRPKPLPRKHSMIREEEED